MSKPLHRRIHDFFRGPTGYTGTAGEVGPKGDPGSLFGDKRLYQLEHRIEALEQALKEKG